ncbi:hypothetical protein [Deinococcus yavapaiensis]|uniref:Abortive infection protein n=1 Tax=Deinococcus yavapaiensis KR-236 TaxID=694435 RepID=A0A318S9P3_9DEIO|nr:hypothetical protein [Deinococcus yavapaiensis]PYE53183.1 hypothetical protein DES52_110167 [Deinococcus yavapaiensis KR-236]
MRGNGITYDTGFFNGVTTTHEPFDLDAVRHDLRVIRDDLHCTAVRLTGALPERLDLAARHAAALGLEVWFSPFTYELDQDALLDLLLDCANRAERLRREGARVVLVTGAELSLFTSGFLPGDTADARLSGLLARDPRILAGLPELPKRINAFLRRAVEAVRTRFSGPVTYASIHFEGVDWTPFDFAAYDVYRTKESAPHFHAGLRAMKAMGKPLAITEFGCATFHGAADMGALGADIVEYEDGHAVRLKGEYARDEAEQARCIAELVDAFEEAGVDSAFLCTFACFYLPHRPAGGVDFDLASLGVVKVHPPAPNRPDHSRWTPKASFNALADAYRSGA